ncbi:hypothetical protein ACFXJJ_16610, partial [Streptomyces sp. NPDC059233]
MLCRQIAYGVVEKASLLRLPLPPIAIQCVASVPTTPGVSMYSATPSALGTMPITWLPLDISSLPMAWSAPPPETRPSGQSACEVTPVKGVAGPMVAPGVATVTSAVLAYAAPGTATVSSPARSSALAVAELRRSFVLMGFSLLFPCAWARGRVGGFRQLPAQTPSLAHSAQAS